MSRKPYPTDLTDEQWALVEPLIPPALPGGRPRKTDAREVVNALLYLVRGGIPWRAMPHDLPPWKTCYNYFWDWTMRGVWDRILTALREQARVKEGREPTPSAGSLDSQSVKVAGAGGERGFDPGKKVSGRKRHIAVDSTGLLLAVVVTAACVPDAAAAQALLAMLPASRFPRLRLFWVDGAYNRKGLLEWAARATRFTLELVRGLTAGWSVLPRRWVVERTFAWLGRARRLGKDYERRTDHSEAMVKLSAIHHLIRRLRPPRRGLFERWRDRFRYDETRKW